MEKKYVCGFCGKEFNNLSNCLLCEFSHKNYDTCKFTHDVYEPGNSFPEKTIIADRNGECAIYERTAYVKDNVIMNLISQYDSCDKETRKDAKKKLIEYIENFM